MLTVDVYVKSRLAHQRPRCEAFVEGMRAAGTEVRARFVEGDQPTGETGDMALFWSGKFRAVQRAYRHWVLLEGARWLAPLDGAMTAGWNGYHGGARYHADPADGSRRPLFPWPTPAHWRRRDADGYVLILGQVNGDYAARAVHLPSFYRDAAAFYQASGCEVRFRPHPHAPAADGPPGIVLADGPIEDALAAARLTVSWTTNGAIDSVVAGVPAVSMDPESMAWPVAAHAFTTTPPRASRAERTRWLNALTQTEWTLDEVRAGMAWRRLRRELEG